MSGHAEQWLSAGCGPGGHTLIAVAGASEGTASLRCTRCDREEQPGGATCLVCPEPGAVRAVLTREPGATEVHGLLCAACAADLFAGPAEGWRARQEVCAEGGPGGL